MNYADPPFCERVPQSTVRAYDEGIRPNVYVVAHLQRCLWDQVNECNVYGSRQDYDAVAYGFIRDVSRSIRGKRAYDRSPMDKKRLPNLTTLELGWGSPHLNICIHRPKWIRFDHFRDVMRSLWVKNPWAASGSAAFFCEERSGDCVGYSLKEGPGAVLDGPLSFHTR